MDGIDSEGFLSLSLADNHIISSYASLLLLLVLIQSEDNRTEEMTDE